MGKRGRRLAKAGREQRVVSVKQQLSASFSGPLPPPAILERYNEIIPNGAERIMTLVEKQTEHRHKIELVTVDGNATTQSRGQIFAFVLSLIVIGVGAALIWQGKKVEGLVALLSPLAILAGVFFVAKSQQRAEREQRRADLFGKGK